MDDLVKEFLAESTENLDRLDSDLVKLEGEPDSTETLASIFRGIHSIKGACGFFGFNKLQAVAHAGENLLSKLRDKKLELTPERITVLLATVDAIRQMLANVSNRGNDGDEEYAELVARLKALQEESSKEPEAAAAPAKRKKKLPVAGRLGGMLVERRHVSPDDLARALDEQEHGDGRPLGEILVSLGVVTAEEVQKTLTLLAEMRSQAAASEGNIRVGVGLLDRLMDLVGELVLSRNQILKFAMQQDDPALLSTMQRLNVVTTELREGVMKTRMQPISRLFDKVPRLVRDVSVACGKQVRVETEGKDTELDRTLIEAINDPLTHLVRNAVDHGLETPAERKAAGKNEEGVLRLRALHEGGQVTVEVSDDGKGIDVERIRRKAVEKSLLRAEEAAALSAEQALNLIFQPGFSTAEKVTNVSGRGVGLDVVRTNIEKAGGSVEIQTRPGEGSTFRVKVPLTLAIVPALIVRSAGRWFAIPQVNLVELVRVEKGSEQGGIEQVHEAQVYRLRGRLLPLVALNQELRMAKPGEGNEPIATNIVVLQVDNRQFGLVVDEVHDTEEIVVRPLSKHLKGIRAYAGATIMGDGKLALILDVPGLAHSARLAAENHDRAVQQDTTENAAAAEGAQKFVLFKGGGDARMALPLDTLARLEQLSVSQIERSGTRWVAQYRGQILPLVRVGEALDGGGCSSEDFSAVPAIQVLVLNGDKRPFGLVVEEIVDIVESNVVMRTGSTRSGVLYSAVVAGHVTELLDAAALAAVSAVHLPGEATE